MIQKIFKSPCNNQVCDQLLGDKYRQRFTFNFIRMLTTSQDISFNELNLRKCLTVKLNFGQSHKSFLESISGVTQEMNEAFLTLLRFGLDTEGGANQQLWVQKLAESIQSVEDVKLMSHICRTFVEGIEFKGGEY